MKRIYLFNIVTWNYRKKRGFPVCKKENFAGLEANRKRGKSARASPTPHHTLNEERSARFTAQPLSALVCSSLGSTRGPRTARATRLWTPSAQRFAPRFALNKWIEAFDLYTFLWCALKIKLVKTINFGDWYKCPIITVCYRFYQSRRQSSSPEPLLRSYDC